MRSIEDITFSSSLDRFRLNLRLEAGDIDYLASRSKSMSTLMDHKLNICLFPRNKPRARFNFNTLDTFPGREYSFWPQFKGSFKNLRQWVLRLKIGCPVMIQTNLKIDSGATNGAIRSFEGIITLKNQVTGTFDQSDVKALRVRLHSSNKVISITRLAIPQKKYTSRDISHLRQFPLDLAWGITIHKSQGKTIRGCFGIDCENIVDPTMFYVALSRATRL